MTDYSTDHNDSSGIDTDGDTGGSAWQEFWDAQAQAKYWYNNATGEATWTRPEDLAVGDFSSRSASSSVIGSTAPVNPANADEWVSYIDEDTGQEYWYNSVTGETSWG